MRYRPIAITKDGVICDIETVEISVSGGHGHYGGWNNGKNVLVPFDQFRRVNKVEGRGMDKIADRAFQRAIFHLSRKQQDSVPDSQITKAGMVKSGTSKTKVSNP